MADTKISALTASTTPLAGTEVLPIVQSGTTVKVAVADLTAGRAVSMSGLTVTSTGLNIPTITGGTGTNEGAATYYKAGATIVTAFGDTSAILGGATATSATIYTGASMPLNIAVSGGTKWQFTAAGNLAAVQSGNGIDFSATPGTGTSELLADYEEGTWTPSQGAGLVVVGTFSSDGVYTKVGNLVTVRGRLVGSTSVAATAAAIMCGNLPFTSSGQPFIGSMMNGPGLNASGTVATSGTDLYSTSMAATAVIYFSVTYFV
jgi:hypothetical protein